MGTSFKRARACTHTHEHAHTHTHAKAIVSGVRWERRVGLPSQLLKRASSSRRGDEL